jgi:hypothetical protein
MSRNTRLREYQIPVVIRDIPDKFEKVIHNPVFPGDIVEVKAKRKKCNCCKEVSLVVNYYVKSRDKTKARTVCIDCWDMKVKKRDGTISKACGGHFSQIRGILNNDFTAEEYEYGSLDNFF